MRDDVAIAIGVFLLILLILFILSLAGYDRWGEVF
jgi:ABC-type multidrug transport system permease subunit